MSDIPRYLVLGDTILDREKIISIYMHPQILGRVVVQLQGAEDHHFDGGDARILWKLFDGDTDFRDED